MKKIIISSIVIAIVVALTAFFVVRRSAAERIIRDVVFVVQYDEDEYGFDCGREAIADRIGRMKKDIVGKSVGDTTLYLIRERILEMPFVKECCCFTYADSLFRIEVSARKSFVKLICNDGRVLYADAGGNVMDLAGYKVPAEGFVVFRGECAWNDKEWVEGAVDLAIKTFGISEEATLKEIVVETPTKLNLMLDTKRELMPKLTVHFGDLHSQESKLARLETFFTQIYPTATKKYKTVDVRYSKQLICK